MEHGLGITLNTQDGAPLYQQVVQKLTRKIDSGMLPVGFRLPPTRSFAKALGVHRNTVVRAFEELQALGLIDSIVGKGTFVAQLEEEKDRFKHKQTQVDHRLPWDTLRSRGTQAEPFMRIGRLSRHTKHPDLIDVSRMQPSTELFPVDRFRLCMDHVLRTKRGKALGYGDKQGILRLRELLVERLARRGIPTKVEDILITTGSQQGLDLVIRSLLDPGDSILMQDTSYTGAISITALRGARAIGVPSDNDGPRMDFLARLGTRQVKAFYLMPDACNPTGLCISEARRRELISWSHEYGIPLIEDDYVADIELDDQMPPIALRALDNQVIYIGTFSKTLIPALRLGYLVCPPELQKYILPLKNAMDLGTSALSQHALAEFLERGYMRAHLKTLCAAFRERRDVLQASLEAHLPPEISWKHVSRGPSIWLSLPDNIAPDAAYEAARQHGVLVSPSTLHEVGNQRSGGLRLVFIYQSPQRLKEAGERLGQALQKLITQAKASGSSSTFMLNGV